MQRRVGRGKAYGAVTIVNAISTGRGSALGVDLYTEALARIRDEPGIELRARHVGGPTSSQEPMDPSLASEVASLLFERLGMRGIGCEIETTSSIPVAVGLKSSSSAAVAIALAIQDAVGASLPCEELLGLVAEASQRSGTSITGALDDASACMLGGVVVTDNTGRRVIKRDAVYGDLKVVIAVPGTKQYTKQFRREALDPIRELVTEAFSLALRGEYWKAMTLNGVLHASVLGIPAGLILEAVRAGALGAGLSGTGPAIAAVARGGDVEAVGRVLRTYSERVITCSVNNAAAYRCGSLTEGRMIGV